MEEEQKQKIAQEALEMFLKCGFRSVSMDDIATQMGISKKTVYKHYTNKAELVDAAVLLHSDQILRLCAYFVKKADNAIDELMLFHREMHAILRSQHPGIQFQLKKYYPETYEKVIGKRKNAIYTAIHENLKRGMKSGHYRDNLNLDIMAQLYFSNMLYVMDESHLPDSIFDVIELNNQVIEYHIRAVASPKGLAFFERLLELSD